MYTEDVRNTPLFIHAMSSHNLSTIPQNYLVITVRIGGKTLKSLVDTGAQPSVIKESCVPLGTIIKKTDICIKGVRGPKVKVLGFANIPIRPVNRDTKITE